MCASIGVWYLRNGERRMNLLSCPDVLAQSFMFIVQSKVRKHFNAFGLILTISSMTLPFKCFQLFYCIFFLLHFLNFIMIFWASGLEQNA